MFGLGLIALPALTFCIVLGANNLSTWLGTSVGARAVTYPRALTLTSIGLFTFRHLGNPVSIPQSVVEGIFGPPSPGAL